jgi:phage major head subunit gpT-like protein
MNMHMNYFQDPTGTLHALSDEDIANGGNSLLPAGCTELTDAEAQAIINPPLTLAQAQADQIALMYTSYATAIAQPVAYTSKAGVAKTYQADTASQTVLMQATQGYGIAGATPTGFYWVAADNTQVPFTLADLQGLYGAMLAQGWTAFQNLQSKKTAINAATTVKAAQAVTWA